MTQRTMIIKNREHHLSESYQLQKKNRFLFSFENPLKTLSHAERALAQTHDTNNKEEGNEEDR